MHDYWVDKGFSRAIRGLSDLSSKPFLPNQALSCQRKYAISITARDVQTRAPDRPGMQIDLSELNSINIGSMFCLHSFLFQPVK